VCAKTEDWNHDEVSVVAKTDHELLYI